MGAGYSGGIYISSSAQIADGVVAKEDLGIPTTKGGLLTYSTAPAELSAGADGYVLVVDSTQAEGVKWDAPSTISGLGTPVILYPIYSDSVIAGTWTPSYNTSAYDNLYTYSAGAINEEISWKAYIGAGTWKITMAFRYLTGAGIATFSINGTDVGTIDTYGAGGTYNNLGTISAINIPASGFYNINIKMATKNGSATNYQLGVCGAIVLNRTA